MKRASKRRIWDHGGVSEVIGTVLTLSITVVLFSSIIVMVDQFPTPSDNVYTDFTAAVEPRIDPSNGTYYGAYIHITNTGGQQMTGDWTIIVLTIDDFTYTLDTKGVIDTFPYGLGPAVPGHRGPDNGDDNWDTGERWTIYRNNTDISPDSSIGVMILDSEKNAVAWSSSIQGVSNEFGPIITKIRADSDLGTLRSDPIEYGRPFVIYADVYDPDGNLNTTSVYLDFSAINPNYDRVNMSDPDGDGTFISDKIMGPNTTIPIGYHVAIIHAEDLDGMHSSGVGRVAVGMDIGSQPNLVIRAGDISLSSRNPINGQTVLISATVKNYGGHCDGVMNFYDVIGDQSTVNQTNLITSENFTISDSPDQITRTVSWPTSFGGVHTIVVEALPINAADADPSDNSNSTNVTVMPTILLVDDDNHVSDLTGMDTVSYMRGALDSSNFEYDLYTVANGKNGPEYLRGETRLRDYDVVIWMTGYEKTDTLTQNDQENITAFLNDGLGYGRTGSLWLIGQYLFEDHDVAGDGGVTSDGANVETFIINNLNVINSTSSSSGPNPLRGVAGNPVSDDWSNSTIPIIERVPGESTSYRVGPNLANGAEITFRTGGDPPNPGDVGDAIDYENAALDSRVLFCPWEFSRIEMTADQTQVAYKAIMWLGNITKILGQDLAISQQDVNPPFVFYNQKVRVDAVIRNNGDDTLTTDARLYLDDIPLTENGTYIPSIDVGGAGGTATISANWTATLLGTHVLKWKVDPDDHITETNEGNNMVPSYISSGEVFVEFRILVVDDDGSPNNNGTLHNDTRYLTDSLERLDYTYESDNGVNTTYVVIAGDDGPSFDMLKDYSAVLWVTGAANAGLSVNDSLSLNKYILNSNGRLWLIGSDIWSGIPGVNLTHSMGINTTLANLGISGTLRGVDDSGISHGMNISILSNPAADVLVPEPGAEGVFYRDYQAGTYAAVAYDEGDYQAFTCAFNLSTLYGSDPAHISGNNATDELTYMFPHWVGKPDDRNEARITEQDYYVSELHPQIGGAYILRATVNNAGANDINLLVRFMDGTTQIGADSISISSDNSTSAEIIWRPLFAGQRTISILVDPINEVPEVFEQFNNHVNFSIYVYFFWDDMESGASKWTHSSTILSINGEGPLEGYSSYNVSTDIITDWDYTLTTGLENTTRTAHSYDSCFWLEEPAGGTQTVGGRKPIDVVLAIDSSGSMEWDASGTDVGYDDPTSRWYNARVAAIGFIQDMTDQDRCAIYTFNGNGAVRQLRTYYYMTAANKSDFIGALNAYDQNDVHGGTPFFDMIGDSIQYIVNNVIDPDPNPDLLSTSRNEYIIGLGDGATNSDNTWSPDAEWGNTTGGGWGSRDGILKAPPMTYTIGLAGIKHDPAYPLAPDWSRTSPDGNSYPDEYDMWHVADSSPKVLNDAGGKYGENATTGDDNVGHYYYTDDPSQLPSIFDAIFESIQIGQLEGENQTRSVGAPPETRAGGNDNTPFQVANYNKTAVTETFNLENLDSAKLTFWQKYSMTSGANGGFLQIGYKDGVHEEADGWAWKYLIPANAYSGNLRASEWMNDSFGTRMFWCWNGLSGRGEFTWDYCEVDLLDYVPAAYRDAVKIKFNYTQFGGGTGVGWYIDDVRVVVSRAEGAAMDSTTKDIWDLVDVNATYGWNAHSGMYAWSNIDPVTGEMKPGIDNYLMTNPIDLSNAKNAYLSTYFKFNTNYNGGAPPDGFRVEVSSDNGLTWSSINLGVRSAWGISGTGVDADDGNATDGKSYTGIGDSGEGNYATDNYWVEAGTLSRLNLDLGSWNGNQILIRFRVVTNNLPTAMYAHDNNANFGSDPGFGGFFVDDVQVYGETIFG